MLLHLEENPSSIIDQSTVQSINQIVAQSMAQIVTQQQHQPTYQVRAGYLARN